MNWELVVVRYRSAAIFAAQARRNNENKSSTELKSKLKKKNRWWEYDLIKIFDRLRNWDFVFWQTRTNTRLRYIWFIKIYLTI